MIQPIDSIEANIGRPYAEIKAELAAKVLAWAAQKQIPVVSHLPLVENCLMNVCFRCDGTQLIRLGLEDDNDYATCPACDGEGVFAPPKLSVKDGQSLFDEYIGAGLTSSDFCVTLNEELSETDNEGIPFS